MSNFTPLNPKKITYKPKKNNFFLWANLILVVLIAIIGLFYYNQTLQTTKQKAATEGEEIIPGLCGNRPKNEWFQCDSGNGDPNCIFCLRAVRRTCREVLLSRGCPIGAGGNITPGQRGSCASITGPVRIYYCRGDNYIISGKACIRNDPLPENVYWDNSSKTIQGRFCGTIQVDDNYGHFCSKYDTSGCNENQTPQTPTPTPTRLPTFTPTVTPTN
ncbi:MAG: hypothetical protein ACPLRN_03580, partial [Microgenomates group bacterium]